MYVTAAHGSRDRTHPTLVEAVGVPVVLNVILLFGLLELLPEPLYPVVVSHLAAAT